MPKHFVVFAERFEHGAWKYWEHECDKEDIPALEDSATAHAFSRTPSANPSVRCADETCSYADVAYTKHAPNHGNFIDVQRSQVLTGFLASSGSIGRVRVKNDWNPNSTSLLNGIAFQSMRQCGKPTYRSSVFAVRGRALLGRR